MIIRFITDIALMALAYFGAYAIRLNFGTPSFGVATMVMGFFPTCAMELVALILWKCHTDWRVKLLNLPRFIGAFSTILFLELILRAIFTSSEASLFRHPFSVAWLNVVFLSIMMVGVRVMYGRYQQAKARECGLLTRPENHIQMDDVVAYLEGKVVLVTGAGGSIGSELVRQVAMNGAKEVIMVERSENALYEIDRKMRALGSISPCIPVMIDINEGDKMRAVLQKYRPEIILHAAAYKHVPMVELYPEEGYRNNTLATSELGEIATQEGVERFVLISTDKAVNPVSAMGKSKREAEKAVMALNSLNKTSFAAVRFGNVLGSSGSVVPLFEEQIKNGGPVTITHPEMKRYFMTVSEAVSLVLKAAAMRDQVIFTLDMGEPVKIVDLAETMIRQAGYRPYTDIPIVFTGIRPGEKLFEELDVSSSSMIKTAHERIYITKVNE